VTAPHEPQEGQETWLIELEDGRWQACCECRWAGPWVYSEQTAEAMLRRHRRRWHEPPRYLS
jgi:hypothetical protein